MELSEEIKVKIKEEYNSWVEKQYANKSFKERQTLGAFFTPPELTIKMIEKFNGLDGTILDPCAGCGGLLVACIIAGADPNYIYANEFDSDLVRVCKERLMPYGVPEWHIHRGDALSKDSYNFSEDYKDNSNLKEVDLWN